MEGFKPPEGYGERHPPSWRPWLDHLPELVASYLERWELSVVGELPLSYSYVLPVERADGRPCVLKLQPTDLPQVEGAARELLGLRLAGPVAVEVVEEDAGNGALLLERALPGTPLDEMAERDDDAATETLANVIRGYGHPLDDPASLGLRPFEEFAGVFERFDRGPHGGVARRTSAAPAASDIHSARHIAEDVLAELLADRGDPYLLHGDLHHGNVLADEQRGLLVIDPWGLYGERSADVAPALHNPLELVARAPDVDSLIRRRLAIYAEVLELEMDRLTAWCYAYNVIRVLWTLEDGGEVSQDDAGERTVAALRNLM